MWYIPTHVKYKEINDYYRAYSNPKVKYNTFLQRILYHWYTDREKAITEKKYEKRRNNHWIYEDGRICKCCWKYKPRAEFHYTRASVCGMTSQCKECRNKYKAEYRAKTNHQKDREYKQRKRKLTIGEQIALVQPRYINWMPREDIYKVVDYKYKKWYLLQSIIDQTYKWIDTWDNPKSKKFYKV